jgi:3-hydroxyisobutyrate dehydrogenase-like beta-hydroxyacid dehydrogenase
MNVGFIGFGEVASTLSSGLLGNGVNVSTCLEGRSKRTLYMAKKSGVNILDDFVELARTSDILISAVTPSTAVAVAKKLGKYSKGIYVDINNVSPSTVNEALLLVENKRIVDAAIIGSVEKNGCDVQIIACGDAARDFSILNDHGLNIKLMGAEIGHCSQIKIMRSLYTKGVSAILWETIRGAYEMGIDEEVLKIIAETEGPQFEKLAHSRLISSFLHSKRRYEEMGELKKLLSDNKMSNDIIMVSATENRFKDICMKNKKIQKENDEYRYYDSYKDIFYVLKNIK